MWRRASFRPLKTSSITGTMMGFTEWCLSIRKKKPKKPIQEEDSKQQDSGPNMAQDRFLEPFYSTDLLALNNTRFFDHFGINNIPFGIAGSTSRKTPSVAVRHNDLVFFLDSLTDEGYLPALGEATRETFSQVRLIFHIRL